MTWHEDCNFSLQGYVVTYWSINTRSWVQILKKTPYIYIYIASPNWHVKLTTSWSPNSLVYTEIYNSVYVCADNFLSQLERRSGATRRRAYLRQWAWWESPVVIWVGFDRWAKRNGQFVQKKKKKKKKKKKECTEAEGGMRRRWVFLFIQWGSRKKVVQSFIHGGIFIHLDQGIPLLLFPCRKSSFGHVFACGGS